MPRVLLAKTALDGHWRGTLLVARALRDAGFDVIMIGMARADEITRAAVDEGVDLVGLNVGGRVEIVERIVDALAAEAPGVPVFAGGVLPPWACERLQSRRIEVFPPGSSLASIVAAATRLTADGHEGARATTESEVEDGA